MKGFRPAFYEENPNLRSIEILAWAVKEPCFTLSGVKEAFADQLGVYADPTHEVSERLRKLAKSGMIVVADERLISSKEKTLDAVGAPEDRVGAITPERLSVIRQTLQEMNDPSVKRGKGRPPRLYFTTQAAAKYVETRAAEASKKISDYRKPRRR